MNPLLFTLPDIFCVNETEAEIYTNVKINEQQHAVDAIKILLLKGCKKVIITLGEKGSVYGEKGNSNIICVPVLKVNAIDTTVCILIIRNDNFKNFSRFQILSFIYREQVMLF